MKKTFFLLLIFSLLECNFLEVYSALPTCVNEQITCPENLTPVCTRGENGKPACISVKYSGILPGCAFSGGFYPEAVACLYVLNPAEEKPHPQCINDIYCSDGKIPDCNSSEIFYCLPATKEPCCFNKITMTCRVPECISPPASSSNPINSETKPYCENNIIKCKNGSPACDVGKPACGSAFGFTGDLAQPGCVDSTEKFFNIDGEFCSQDSNLVTLDTTSCGDNLCGTSRKNKNCIEDKINCKCICQFKLKGKLSIPRCKNENPICLNGLKPSCTNKSNTIKCNGNKVICFDGVNNKVDFEDTITCIGE